MDPSRKDPAASLARVTAELLELDQRDELSPEEEALADRLTAIIEDYEEEHPLPRE